MQFNFHTEDYVLRWPRDVFRDRLAELLELPTKREGLSSGNADQIEHMLDDAFDSSQPRQDFHNLRAAVAPAQDPWDASWVDPGKPENDFLTQLLAAADSLPYELPRRPYRSQRGGTSQDSAVAASSIQSLARRFVALVQDLESRGFFERSFEKDCVDDPATVDASSLISREIGVDDLWPLGPERLAADKDLLLDAIEVVGEFVAAPQSRTFHSYAGCGWHHSDFNLARGRKIYYWSVNRLLHESTLGLKLATTGEDRGRLVETSDGARDDLVVRAIASASSASRDPIKHAIALFRSRGATTEDKRSACVALAGVLEHRRDQVKAALLRKDEGALFQLANEFDLRHRSASQKADYDPAFLDWIFWWYLSTIELTERIAQRHSS